jgi:hypothetical protein
MLKSSHFALNSVNISFSVNIGSWLPINSAESILTVFPVLCLLLKLVGISSVRGASMDSYIWKDEGALATFFDEISFLIFS